MELATMPDDAGIGVKPDTGFEIHHLAKGALQLGEHPSQGLGIVPDVRAGAGTAVHTLPSVRPAAVEPMKHLGRDAIERDEAAVEQPVRQRAVVPGPVPLAGAAEQSLLVAGKVAGHFARPSRTTAHSACAGWRNPALRTSDLRPASILVVVGEIPGDGKVHCPRFPGSQPECGKQPADEQLVERFDRFFLLREGFRLLKEPGRAVRIRERRGGRNRQSLFPRVVQQRQRGGSVPVFVFDPATGTLFHLRR